MIFDIMNECIVGIYLIRHNIHNKHVFQSRLGANLGWVFFGFSTAISDPR